MSSPKRPSSQASTVSESAGPPNDKRELTSLPTSEKNDPWLVSFAPDDPDNPLVRFSAWL